MRERILVLPVLLSLPIYAYGGITISCPTTNSPDDCWQVPGCEFKSTSYDTACVKCDEGSYCPSGTSQQTNKQDCPAEFSNSPNGSTNKTDCYKNINNNYCEQQNGAQIQTCGLFYDLNITDGIPKCWNPTTGEYNNNYHIEPDNGNKCFSNTRNCNLFGQSGCGDGTVSGTARWSSNETEWITSTSDYCKCEQTNVSYSNCIATVTKKPTGAAPDTANGTITYGNNVFSYKCDKCPAGKYLTQSDFTAQTGCAGGDIACSCTDVEQGYFSPGCTISGTSSCPQSQCTKPGQTTNGTGAGTSAESCHYSDQTKFCDSKGCFSIDNISEWNPN